MKSLHGEEEIRIPYNLFLFDLANGIADQRRREAASACIGLLGSPARIAGHPRSFASIQFTRRELDLEEQNAVIIEQKQSFAPVAELHDLAALDSFDSFGGA